VAQALAEYRPSVPNVPPPRRAPVIAAEKPAPPDPAGVLLDEGVALARQGKHDEAAASYRQALRIKPDYAPARQCGHITVFGARAVAAVTALLHAQPERLVCYDAVPRPAVEALARAAGRTELLLRRVNPLAVEAEEADLLFVDTPHIYERRREELRRHAGKVRQYIVVHRTSVFGDDGEVAGTRGVWPALQEFLAAGTFRLQERRCNHNGLVILERVHLSPGTGQGTAVPPTPAIREE
jgi:tetratricopeptide (TPR) repeat protein